MLEVLPIMIKLSLLMFCLLFCECNEPKIEYYRARVSCSNCNSYQWIEVKKGITIKAWYWTCENCGVKQ